MGMVNGLKAGGMVQAPSQPVLGRRPGEVCGRMASAYVGWIQLKVAPCIGFGHKGTGDRHHGEGNKFWLTLLQLLLLLLLLLLLTLLGNPNAATMLHGTDRSKLDVMLHKGWQHV